MPAAASIIEAQRGVSDEWVFAYRHNAHRTKGGPGRIGHLPKPPRRIQTMNNTGWQNARKVAASRYEEAFGRECPTHFADLHVHDLRHIFGRRLRAAGVSVETRKALMGHTNGDITMHYSLAEMMELVNAVTLIERGVSGPSIVRRATSVPR